MENKNTSLHDTRLKKLTDVTRIISTLPVSTKKQAELIFHKTAGAKYGLEITQPSKEVEKTLDNQIMDII